MKKLKKILLSEPKEEFIQTEAALEPITEGPPEEETIGTFPDFGKWFEKIKAKVKPFPWRGINTKNAIIAGCLVLVAVAGYLNIRYGTPVDTPVENPTPPVQQIEPQEDFFTNAIIDRERARGEALEVLVSITEDETASEAAKANAFNRMEQIANETSWEIDIENLVKAKGFSECVAIINENSANIVVESEGLTAGQVAQIKEIVYLEASIQPKDIKIIEKLP